MASAVKPIPTKYSRTALLVRSVNLEPFPAARTTAWNSRGPWGEEEALVSFMAARLLTM